VTKAAEQVRLRINTSNRRFGIRGDGSLAAGLATLRDKSGGDVNIFANFDKSLISFRVPKVRSDATAAVLPWSPIAEL